jgi:DNA polymerase phi
VLAVRLIGSQLLSRLETVTSAQVISLVMRGSQFNSGMKGSEERDNQFARLFGFTSLIQSQLLFAPSSTLVDFAAVINQLAGLGKSKAWLRESAWWSIAEAVKGLLKSNVEWKESAVRRLAELIYAENAEWTQEKVALTLILQASEVVSFIGPVR